VAVGGQRPRHPDRAVATEGAELEHLPGALHAHQHLQQPSLRRRDLNRGKASGLGIGESAPQRFVFEPEPFRDEGVDLAPTILVHGG
jgi:hypothetical protein